MLIRSAPDLAL